MKKTIAKRYYLGPGHYGIANNLELATFPSTDPAKPEWPGIRLAVQRALIAMNCEQDRDPDSIPAEIVTALLGCGEHFGCNLDARTEEEAEI